MLAFSYQASSTPFASPIAVNDTNWTSVAALNFLSPTTGATATFLDGNAAANRSIFSNILLQGVTLNPGDQIFLRWLDIDDSGNDHGLAVDDFTVNLSVVPEPSTAVLGGMALLGFTVFRRRS
jgi:hypothetical protein